MEVAGGVTADLVRLGSFCTRMGSPFFAAILRHAAGAYEDDSVVRALLDRHAGRSRLGLRLGGAAHYRALRGEAPAIAAHYPSTNGDGDADAAWDAIVLDIRANVARYDELFARNVQTNEVARSTPIVAALLAIADAARLPLRIFEIGSSAGLVLNFDRYFYSGPGWSWGAEGSQLHLHNATKSGTPGHLDAPLQVAERRGCDLHPLNAADAGDADTLLGFIWPDQRERFDRLRAALSIARSYPPAIAQADGIAWARSSAQPRAGALTVLLNTVVTEHMNADVLERLHGAIAEIGAQATAAAPFAWVRMELAERAYETRFTLWPGEKCESIAKSDGHAQNLEWSGA